MAYFIRIGFGNSVKVYLDTDALAEGTLKVDRDVCGEQCSECAADIEESGTLHSSNGKHKVLCDPLWGGCGAVHVVERSG